MCHVNVPFCIIHAIWSAVCVYLHITGRVLAGQVSPGFHSVSSRLQEKESAFRIFCHLNTEMIRTKLMIYKSTAARDLTACFICSVNMHDSF